MTPSERARATRRDIALGVLLSLGWACVMYGFLWLIAHGFYNSQGGR